MSITGLHVKNFGGGNYGGVYSCCAQSICHGDLKQKSLEEILTDPAMAVFKDQDYWIAEPCRSCEFYPVCRGGCRLRAGRARAAVDGGQLRGRCGGRRAARGADGLFDPHGLASAINNAVFFRSCWEHLAEDGALVINLWHKDHAAFTYTYHLLSTQFRGNLLRLPLEGKSNEVVLAFKRAAQITRLDKLRGKAKTLESRYHIEFPRLLRTLRRNNGTWYRRALA